MCDTCKVCTSRQVSFRVMNWRRTRWPGNVARKENGYKIFFGKPEEGCRLASVDIEVQIILGLILLYGKSGSRLDSCGSGKRKMAGLGGHGGECFCLVSVFKVLVTRVAYQTMCSENEFQRLWKELFLVWFHILYPHPWELVWPDFRLFVWNIWVISYPSRVLNSRLPDRGTLGTFGLWNMQSVLSV